MPEESSGFASSERTLSPEEIFRLEELRKDAERGVILAQSVSGPKSTAKLAGVVATCMCILVTCSSTIGSYIEADQLVYINPEEGKKTVLDINANVEVNLPNEFESNSDLISPSGEKMIFIEHVKANGGSDLQGDQGMDLGIRNTRDMSERKILFTTGDGGFDRPTAYRWDKQSQRVGIVTSTPSLDRWGLYVSNLNGEKELVLEEDLPISALDFSYDGSKIAYALTNPDDYFGTEIYIFDLKNRKNTFLVKGEYPLWSIKDEKIAFRARSPLSHLLNLHVIDINGRNERLIAESVGQAVWFKADK